jgi:integrase
MATRLTTQGIKAFKSPARGYIYHWDRALPSFGVRISHTNKKVFVCKYRYKKKQVLKTFKPAFDALSLSDAREQYKTMLNMIERDVDPESKNQFAKTNYTFGRLAQEYIERGRADLSPKTIYNKENMLKNWVRPVLDMHDPRFIQRNEVDDFLQHVKKSAPIIANRCYIFLNCIFKYGIQRQIIENNPMYMLPKPTKEYPKLIYIKKDQDIATLWRTLTAFEKDRHYFVSCNIFKLILITAMRPGAVKTMRRQDINLDKRVWHIPGDFMKGERKKDFIVPLSDIALETIYHVMEDFKSYTRDNSTWLFPADKGATEHITWFTKSTAAIREKSGVYFTPHILRKTASTKMAELKIQPSVVDVCLGHEIAGLSKVARTYNMYEYFDEKKEALDIWSDHLRHITKTGPFIAPRKLTLAAAI